MILLGPFGRRILPPGTSNGLPSTSFNPLGSFVTLLTCLEDQYHRSTWRMKIGSEKWLKLLCIIFDHYGFYQCFLLHVLYTCCQVHGAARSGSKVLSLVLSFKDILIWLRLKSILWLIRYILSWINLGVHKTLSYLSMCACVSMYMFVVLKLLNYLLHCLMTTRSSSAPFSEVPSLLYR